MTRDTMPEFCLNHIRKVYIAQLHVKLRCICKLPSLRVIVLEDRENENAEEHQAAHVYVDESRKTPFDKLSVTRQLYWTQAAESYVALCAEAMEKRDIKTDIRVLLHFYLKMDFLTMDEGLEYLVS